MRVLACPDKFRGTASAEEVAAAIAAAAAEQGWNCVVQPMADGGEGTLEAFGGANRTTAVTGPDRSVVQAEWRLDGALAVVEMARASGLSLVGGSDGNDAVQATSAGTGELISTAADRGAKRIIVGLGGSATTDGGLGALEAMAPLARYRGVDIEVAADVRTKFVDAAAVFGPQKGASTAEVALLAGRLARLAQVYESEHGVDVTDVPRSGAAGGLGGGLFAVGADLRDGFELVADSVGLYEQIEDVDLVITGEGRLDTTSFEGKVVGGVVELARHAEVPVMAIVGRATDDVAGMIPTVDLTATFGSERALNDTLGCVRTAASDQLSDCL